jgi:hypothetical protein
LVPDAEIIHPFPFDRLKFASMLREYLADGRCFARMTGGAPSERFKWLPTPIAIAFRFCKTVVAMPKRGFWETFYSCVVIFGTLIEYQSGRNPMQYPSAPKNPGDMDQRQENYSLRDRRVALRFTVGTGFSPRLLSAEASSRTAPGSSHSRIDGNGNTTRYSTFKNNCSCASRIAIRKP